MICMGCEVAETVTPLRGGICKGCHAEMEAEDAADQSGPVKGHIPEALPQPGP